MPAQTSSIALSEGLLFATLAQLIVIVIAASLGNRLAVRLGQPGAVGEIVAGVNDVAGWVALAMVSSFVGAQFSLAGAALRIAGLAAFVLIRSAVSSACSSCPSSSPIPASEPISAASPMRRAWAGWRLSWRRRSAAKFARLSRRPFRRPGPAPVAHHRRADEHPRADGADRHQYWA